MEFEKAEAADRAKQIEFTEALAFIAKRHSSKLAIDIVYEVSSKLCWNCAKLKLTVD